jgi:hypothetical protein
VGLGALPSSPEVIRVEGRGLPLGRMQRVEVGGELLRSFVGAVHGEAEVYVVLDAADGDGEDEAFAMFAEKRVERGEKD